MIDILTESYKGAMVQGCNGQMTNCLTVQLQNDIEFLSYYTLMSFSLYSLDISSLGIESYINILVAPIDLFDIVNYAFAISR